MTMFPPSTIHYNRSSTPPSNKLGPIGSPPRTTSTTNNSSAANEGMVVALRWLTAIQEATQCLRDRPLAENNQNEAPAIEHALQYLMGLEAILAPLEAQWDQGPTRDPPTFVPYQVQENNVKNKKKKKGRTVKGSDQSPTTVAVGSWVEARVKKNKTNRFALFEDSEDDDDSFQGAITGKTILSSGSTRSTRTSHSLDDLHEAGDVPTLNRIAHFPTGTVTGMRRLMIRIVTAQSELFAYLASGYRRRQLWGLGAKNCGASLLKIHQGLYLADSEISRCFAENKGVEAHLPLMEDAGIVEVAVKSLTTERDSFVQKALTAKHQLIRKLESMYIGRYKARMRLGDDWYKNKPNKPKQQPQYSRRDQKEDELVEIQMALDNLSQWDTRTLIASANHLKLRLNPRTDVVPPGACPRRNGQRPAEISDRVDLVLYPDPSLYGWKFTGSYVERNGQRIEFFEKENMLLDWHYATAQMELSWKFMSRSGNTMFFRSDGPVHSNLYSEIIQSHNPWDVVKSYNKKN